MQNQHKLKPRKKKSRMWYFSFNGFSFQLHLLSLFLPTLVTGKGREDSSVQFLETEVKIGDLFVLFFLLFDLSRVFIHF